MECREAQVKTRDARRFEALGGVVWIQAIGDGPTQGPGRAESAIRDLQCRLTRFETNSELSRLNRDPRSSVPASPIMLRFAGVVGYAGKLSGGLVDATCLDAVELAGYTESIDPEETQRQASVLPARSRGDSRQRGEADPDSRWHEVSTDLEAGTVNRPPGIRLDSGGTGKGLAADVAAEELEGLESFAVSCAGDIRFGGTAGIGREIQVASPFEGEPSVATLRLSEGAVATSGITRRSWIDPDGRPAHHLINPATGSPAWTGVTQVTAIAPTGVEAEVRAKAALLSGPQGAARWLVHGGVVVLDDNRVVPVGIDGLTGRAVR